MGRVGASVSGVCDVLAAGGVGEVLLPVDGPSRSRRLKSSDQCEIDEKKRRQDVKSGGQEVQEDWFQCVGELLCSVSRFCVRVTHARGKVILSRPTGCLLMNNKLKVLRAERGWSQENLANALEVSRQTVNALETGRYDPSLPLAFRLAKLFGKRIEEIFQDDE